MANGEQKKQWKVTTQDFNGEDATEVMVTAQRAQVDDKGFILLFYDFSVLVAAFPAGRWASVLLVEKDGS